MPDILRWLRKTAGWTQAQLASELGVSPISVSRWENNHVAPDKRSRAGIRRLLRACGMSGVAAEMDRRPATSESWGDEPWPYEHTRGPRPRRPGPNKLRFVEANAFQCLRCQQRIYDTPGIYCTFCGTRWELGHVTNRRREQLARAMYERCVSDPKPEWLIQHRYIHPTGEVSHWMRETKLYGDCNAHAAYRTLKKLKDLDRENAIECDFGIKLEYRVQYLLPSNR